MNPFTDASGTCDVIFWRVRKDKKTTEAKFARCSNCFCVLAATKFCEKLKMAGSVPGAEVNPVSDAQKKKIYRKRK